MVESSGGGGGSPLLLQGLKCRLDSHQLKLKEKLTLVVNLVKCNLSLPNKHGFVLDWFITVLSAKYAEDAWKPGQLKKFWDGFSESLKIIELEEKAPVFKADLLLNIVAQLDLTCPVVAESMGILLNLVQKQDPEGGLLFSIISGLMKQQCSLELQDTMLGLLDKIVMCLKLPTGSELGELMALFSTNTADEEKESFSRIVRKLLFSRLESFQSFFQSVSVPDTEKFTPAPEVQVLLDFLDHAGDIALVLSTLRDQSYPTWLKSNLFCLALHLEGVRVYPPDSVLLAQLSLSSKPDLSRLERIVYSSLPLDLSFEVSEGLKLGNLLTDMFKVTLEKFGMDGRVCRIQSAIFAHHPLSLEPLVSTLLVRYLADPQAPLLVFQTVLDLMLKLRQLPKLVSKLLLHLRTAADAPLSWSKEDMVVFSRAVSQVPRVQSIEMWKTLQFHLTADSIPVRGDPAGLTVWRVAAPLLTTVLASAQLSDHNVPEPLYLRVKELVRSTLTQVLCPTSAHSMEPRDQELYGDLVNSFLEMSELLSTYRSVEFEDVAEFRNGVIKLVLKKKSMKGYERIILKALRSESEFESKIWRIFHQDLLGTREYFEEILDLIPVEYLKAELPSECSAELLNSTRYTALVLYSQFSKIESIEVLAPVSQLRLWMASENWYSLQSELSKVLQNVIHHLEEFDIGCLDPASLDRLAELPVESLPKVQKLGATVLCLVCVLSTQSVSLGLTNLLARCLEDTDIFRYLNSAPLLERLLRQVYPSSVLLESLAVEISKYTKMISELTENFDKFQESLFRGDANSLVMFVNLLEHLARPILEGNVAKEKKDAAEKLALLIAKCLSKFARKDDLLEGSDLLLTAACALVKILWRGGEEGKELGKLEKFIRRILDSSLALSSAKSLRLVSALLDVDERTTLLTEEHRVAARTIALGNVASPEGTTFLTKLLRGSSQAQIVDLFQDYGLSTNYFELAKVMLSIKLTDDSRSSVQPYLEDLTFKVLMDDTVDGSDKCDYVTKLVSCTPSLLSASVETAALASLLTGPLSKRTLVPFVMFVNNRPHLSLRQIPLVCAAVRLHLQMLETAGPTSEIHLGICSALTQLISSCKRRKEDWGNVAPYLVADLINTNIAVENPKVKQALSAASYLLMDICEVHSYEYLSANLPAATNELFKVALQTYKVHHKFTGKNT